MAGRRVALVLAVAVVVAGAAAVGADEGWRSTFAALKIKITLLEKLGSDALGIHVERSGDEVVLTGEVGARSTQELAEEVALSVDGVDSVDNRITVKPEEGGRIERAARDAGREIDDAILESKVKLRLFEELGEHAGAIEVEAVEGVVSLRGTVPDRDREKIALATAKSVKGVAKVVDLLTTPR